MGASNRDQWRPCKPHREFLESNNSTIDSRAASSANRNDIKSINNKTTPALRRSTERNLNNIFQSSASIRNQQNVSLRKDDLGNENPVSTTRRTNLIANKTPLRLNDQIFHSRLRNMPNFNPRRDISQEYSTNENNIDTTIVPDISNQINNQDRNDNFKDTRANDFSANNRARNNKKRQSIEHLINRSEISNVNTHPTNRLNVKNYQERLQRLRNLINKRTESNNSRNNRILSHKHRQISRRNDHVQQSNLSRERDDNRHQNESDHTQTSIPPELHYFTNLNNQDSSTDSSINSRSSTRRNRFRDNAPHSSSTSGTTNSFSRSQSIADHLSDLNQSGKIELLDLPNL